MRQLLTIIGLLLMAATAMAEITIDWWGLAAFRVRSEETREYTTIAFPGAPGELLKTIQDGTTRTGYQLGLRLGVREDLAIGLTFRSGLYGRAQVMLQDITSREGLLPAIQEAYIDWNVEFARVQMGRIPQAGTALWDLYAATAQTDFRMDDPRDGVFNDRMAALNGVRLGVPVGAFDIRGVYHTDYTTGFQRTEQGATVRTVRSPDQYIFLFGFDWDGSRMPLPGTFSAVTRDLKISFDYGFPSRAAVGSDLNSRSAPEREWPDFVYADESLWGASVRKSVAMVTVAAGYAHTRRDSVYEADFKDLTLTADIYGVKPTVRYQEGLQTHEAGIYRGNEVKRTAWHFLAAYDFKGVEIQPRMILFRTDIAGFRERIQTRVELTTSVRF
ncbi:MAG: porin [Calditrichaeota bacterium]|nr:porin [Calditrichota bacterium]